MRNSRWRPTLLIRMSIALHLLALIGVIAEPAQWRWALGAVLADHALLALLGLWPRSRWLGPNWTRLPAASTARNEIALTIDDGPDPVVTPQVLDMLDRHAAQATFFCIGEKAARYPDLCREIVRRGHAVENHSQHHRHYFALLGRSGITRELQTAQDTLTAITGQRPLFFRAPAGLRNPFLDPVLARLGLRLASWSARGFDTRIGDAERVKAGCCAACARVPFCCCTTAMLRARPRASLLFWKCSPLSWPQLKRLICVLSPCGWPFHDPSRYCSIQWRAGLERRWPAGVLEPPSRSGNIQACGSQKHRNHVFHQPVFRCLLLFAQRPGLPDNGDAHHLDRSADRFSAPGPAAVSVAVALCFPAPGIAGDAARAVWLCRGHGRNLPCGADRLLLLAHGSTRGRYRLDPVSRPALSSKAWMHRAMPALRFTSSQPCFRVSGCITCCAASARRRGYSPSIGCGVSASSIPPWPRASMWRWMCWPVWRWACRLPACHCAIACTRA